MNIHPFHLLVAFDNSTRLTVDDLFTALDETPPQLRDEIMLLPYAEVVGFPNDSQGKTITEMNYTTFKGKCVYLSKSINESFLITSILREALTHAFRRANPKEKATSVEMQKYLNDVMQRNKPENDIKTQVAYDAEQAEARYVEFCSTTLKRLLGL